MNPDSHCSEPACGCSLDSKHARWARRNFLKAIGAGAGTLALHPWPGMAGPFTRADFEKLVPADKKLRPEWVESLTARGQRTVYRGADLEKIGMPIGGICAGQVYLGGDGKLWHWDIFNRQILTRDEHYAKPMAPAWPFAQGFAVRWSSGGQTGSYPLDQSGGSEISFIGEYPIGYVQYDRAGSPLDISLEAFSPFIPLNTDDSSLPATVMEFTLKNRGTAAVQFELAGWLENAVCLYSGEQRGGMRRNRLARGSNFLLLDCTAEPPAAAEPPARPDILFDDFEHETYEKWTATGAAFGTGPVEIGKIPSYQGDVHGQGKRVVNSHASAPGKNADERDAAIGTLTSVPFTIERNFIGFLLGGGNHKAKTCMNLLVEDRAVLSAAGQNNNGMEPVIWDMRRWGGKRARLQVIDNESGSWGNIGVDQIVFSDHPRGPLGPLAAEPDFGSMCLVLLNPQAEDFGRTALESDVPAAAFSGAAASSEPVTKPFAQKLLGSLARQATLPAGASVKVTFLLTWHMPNLSLARLPGGRFYATRFGSARAVAQYIAENFERLSAQTRLWHDTWYDSTMPYWFLDRTFLNTSILASATCHRFADGRFYGWEGVGCCAGTCAHVWQYAHAVARLFPELERQTREQVDFGLALQPDGAIHFRGEFNDFPAIDAQAGTILRALRKHQTAHDDAFLRRIWPRVKRATEWLIAKDENGDGLIESNQHNTLDTDWFGPVSWLSGLYLSTLLAAETMARECDDPAFAEKCRKIFHTGQKQLVSQLFNGEYFINKPDPKHPEAINSGSGCEIDQVFGQSWAFQVGLPRVFPEKETRSALESLWRYNFTPDVGPYRKVYQPGRWYAMPGEAGLLMCTFPRRDWDFDKAKGQGHRGAAGYFNECMNGFEYQAAGHMLWEGLLTEGLAVTRAVHDRYHPSRRNPWNEVECGDHYARSMASYGVFLAACGFEYHGPKAHLGFAPRLLRGDQGAKGNFKCAFTTAQGWGTYHQRTEAGVQRATVLLKWGRLRVRTLSFALAEGLRSTSAEILFNGQKLENRLSQSGSRVKLTLADPVEVQAEQKLELSIA